MNIFISHSSVNAELAQELCVEIENSGHKCFIAPRDIRLGHEYASEIVIGIDNSDVMVLLLSKEANESPRILREVERAVSRSIPIILYKLEEVELSKSMECFLMTHQWINATDADFTEIVWIIKELLITRKVVHLLWTEKCIFFTENSCFFKNTLFKGVFLTKVV